MQVFSWVENISTRYSTFRQKLSLEKFSCHPGTLDLTIKKLTHYFVKKVEVNFCWKNHAKIYIVQQ